MSILFSLFLFVLIDVLGFSIVLPLFPYLTSEYGLTPVEIGLLQTSNAAAQLVAVPIIGSLSDKYGRRPLLIICVLGTIISFVMLATASNASMLFASRILDGLLGGNISLAQAYIADVTSDQDRAKGMGLLGAAFGLGFIVGPAIGGTLSKYSHTAPSWIAVALSIINLVSVVTRLPESLPTDKRVSSFRGSSSLIPTGVIQEFSTNRRLKMTLLLRLGNGIVFTAFEMTFGFFTKIRLGTDARTSSYLLALYGVAFTIVQAGGMRSLTQRYQERGLFALTLAALSVVYIISGVSASVIQYILVLIPLGALSGIANTLISTLVSQEVSTDIQGGTLGISAALGSFTRIVAPLAGTFLVQHVGASAPALFCSMLSIPLAYLSWTLNKEPRPTKKQDNL